MGSAYRASNDAYEAEGDLILSFQKSTNSLYEESEVRGSASVLLARVL